MFQKIIHAFDFIAIENFTSVAFYQAWAGSLAAILFLIFAFQLISGVFVRPGKSQFNSASEEFVLRFSIGISFTCFIICVFALLSIVTIYSIGAFSLLSIAYVSYTTKTFIKVQFFILLQTIKEYKLFCVLFLIASIPSLLPPLRYDEMSYHIPYMLEFINAKGVITDPYMRYPCYTFNWHMIEIVTQYFHPYYVTHLLNWSVGCICAIAIIELSKRFKVNMLVAKIAGLAFFVSPLVQRCLNVMYLDIPQMFFILISLYAIYLAKKDNSKLFVLAAAIICGMFLGIKITNFLYIPLFAAYYYVKNENRQLVLFFIPLVFFGGLWYARSYVVSGDPITPVLNFKFRGADPFWNKTDFEAMNQDIYGSRLTGLSELIQLPLSMINALPENKMNDWPLLGYVFIFPLFLIYLFRNFMTDKWFLFLFCVFGIALWTSTSVKIRYSHHLALSLVGAAIIWNDIYFYLSNKIPLFSKKIFIVLISTGVFIGPTPAAFSYFKNNLSWEIPFSNKEITESATYGNPEILSPIDSLKQNNIRYGSSIYSFHLTHYKYYFVKDGYHVIGDVISEHRFSDFTKSVQENKLDSFFQASGVKAFWLDRVFLKEDKIEAKIDSLISVGHFKKILINTNTTTVGIIE